MRILLRDAFRERFGREATRPEIQCVQAVAALESSYGEGWKAPGIGSHNFGAIQAGSTWKGETFQYTDTRPNSDGSSTPYVTKFRRYASASEGASDLVRVVYQARGRDKLVLPPASLGDTLGFSRGLHATGYYEGFGATVEDRIRNHHRAVMSKCEAMARGLAEPMPDDSEPPRPTLRLGSREKADVQYLQHLLNTSHDLRARPPLRIDGDFGKRTDEYVKAFQRMRGLKPDGAVGPFTWLQLLDSLPPGGSAA